VHTPETHASLLLPSLQLTATQWKTLHTNNTAVTLLQKKQDYLEVSYNTIICFNDLPQAFVDQLIIRNPVYFFTRLTPVSFIVEGPMSGSHGCHEMHVMNALATWVYANQGANGKRVFSSTTDFVMPIRMGNSFLRPDGAVMDAVRYNSVPAATRAANRFPGVPDAVIEIRSASEDLLAFLSKCSLFVKCGVEFIIAIDPITNPPNNYYFCADPSFGGVVGPNAALMPILPGGIVALNIALDYLLPVMADYPPPAANAPPNYPLAGVPGVLQATIPWAISTVVNGAGILAGFTYNCNTLPPM